MNPTVVFHGHFPEGVAEKVRVSVDHWLPFLPRWVRRLTVIYEEGESDASLSCVVFPEYRRMTLCVRPGWWDESPDKRHADVLHEFMHAPMEAAQDVFFNLLKATTEEGSPLDKWAREEYRKALECAVNDLEDIVVRTTEVA